MNKRCLVVDVDGTKYRWQLFHDWIAGMVQYGFLPKFVLARAEEELQAYRDRQGSFKDFLDVQLEAYQGHERLKGIRVRDAQWVAKQVIAEKGRRVHVFVRELMEHARDLGFMIAFISGSPLEVVEALAAEDDVDIVFGTEHPREDGYYTGGDPKVWAMAKHEALDIIVKEYGADLSLSIAIGDSEGDIPVLERVAYPICFNPNETLYRAARASSNRWPVVIERKLVYVENWSKRKMRKEAFLKEMLPEELGVALEARLRNLHLIP